MESMGSDKGSFRNKLELKHCGEASKSSHFLLSPSADYLRTWHREAINKCV